MEKSGQIYGQTGQFNAPFENELTRKRASPCRSIKYKSIVNGIISNERPSFRPTQTFEINGAGLIESMSGDERRSYLSNVFKLYDQRFQKAKASPTSLSKVGKRRSSNEESNFSPSRKQHITEEKMASCMQLLSLEADNAIPTAVGSIKQQNDDSDFEDDCNLDDEIDDEKFEERHPIFELHTDFKKRLEKQTPLLPESIMDNIRRSSPCLAIIPYVPPQDFVRNMVKEKIDEVIEKEDVSPSIENPAEPMALEDNEYFELAWDTDSDNDLILD